MRWLLTLARPLTHFPSTFLVYLPCLLLRIHSLYILQHLYTCNSGESHMAGTEVQKEGSDRWINRNAMKSSHNRDSASSRAARCSGLLLLAAGRRRRRGGCGRSQGASCCPGHLHDEVLHALAVGGGAREGQARLEAVLAAVAGNHHAQAVQALDGRLVHCSRHRGAQCRQAFRWQAGRRSDGCSSHRAGPAETGEPQLEFQGSSPSQPGQPPSPPPLWLSFLWLTCNAHIMLDHCPRGVSVVLVHVPGHRGGEGCNGVGLSRVVLLSADLQAVGRQGAAGGRQVAVGAVSGQAWLPGPACAAGGSGSAFRQPKTSQPQNGRCTRRSVAPTFPARANPATRRAITTSSRRNQLHRGGGRGGQGQSGVGR